jgi:hypothetical protein
MLRRAHRLELRVGVEQIGNFAESLLHRLLILQQRLPSPRADWDRRWEGELRAANASMPAMDCCSTGNQLFTLLPYQQLAGKAHRSTGCLARQFKARRMQIELGCIAVILTREITRGNHCRVFT